MHGYRSECARVTMYSCSATLTLACRARRRLSEANRFDLLLSQQWLRNRIWQLTVSHCLSSTDASDVELQPSYSLLIAKETVRVCRSFEREALEANGVGVVSLNSCCEISVPSS